MKKFFKVVLVILLVAAIGFGVSTIFWLPKIISDKKEDERLEQIQPWVPEDLPNYNNDKTEPENVDPADFEKFDYIIKNAGDKASIFPLYDELYSSYNEKYFKVIGKFTFDLDFSARSSGGDFKYFPSIFLATKSNSSGEMALAQGFLLDMYGDGVQSYTKEEYDRRFSSVGGRYVEVHGKCLSRKISNFVERILYDITIEFLSDNDERVVEMMDYMIGSKNETEEKLETIDLENGILVTDLTKLSKSDAYAETEFLLYKTNDEKYFGKTYKFKGSVGFFRDDKEIDAWKMRVWVYDDLVTPDGKAIRFGNNVYFSIGEKDTITLQEFKDMFQVEEENMARYVTVEGTLEKRVIDGRMSLFLENATYEIVK